MLRRLACLAIALAALSGGIPAFGDHLTPVSPPGANDAQCTPDISRDHTGVPPSGHIHPPIVLVHGTAVTAQTMSFFSAALRGLGYCPWAVELPSHATWDLESTRVSLLQFVNTVRAQTSDGYGTGKVSLIGHSQGGMQIRHMLLHNPETPVEDAISLSGSHKGTETPALLPCTAFWTQCQMFLQGGCAACWQQSTMNTTFFFHLNGSCATNTCGALIHGTASYTQIVSLADEIVFPYWRALIGPANPLPGPPGARVADFVLQAYCPADASDHNGILLDVNALRIALDALQRSGPARPGAIPCA